MSSRSSLPHPLVTFAVALLAGALAGCGPDFARMDIGGKIEPPGGEINVYRVIVPQGLALKAHIVPRDDDNQAMALEIRSENEDILEIAETINDRDYVFLGKRVGPTRVVMKADGVTVLVLEAHVPPQP
jgi:hypothetical protein